MEPLTYDSALRYAVKRVNQTNESWAVYRFDQTTGAIGTTTTNRQPPRTTILAIVDIWDDNTIQIRESGARSTFLNREQL